jgi:hypothetical protein
MNTRDRHRYSVGATANWPCRADADRIVAPRVDGGVADHPDSFTRLQIICDPWRHLLALRRMLGVLRNGAPLEGWDLTAGLVQSASKGTPSVEWRVSRMEHESRHRLSTKLDRLMA